MEVCRRSKHTNKLGCNEDVTTFYVARFKDGTSKVDQYKSFGRTFTLVGRRINESKISRSSNTLG